MTNEFHQMLIDSVIRVLRLLPPFKYNRIKQCLRAERYRLQTGKDITVTGLRVLNWVEFILKRQ